MVPNNPEILHAAQVIQAMAKRAGFDIKIQATEFASALQLAAKGDFEAFLIGWSGRTDPDGNIYNFVSCKAPPALNVAHYCNQDVDRELDAARDGRSAGPSASPITQSRRAHLARTGRSSIFSTTSWLYAAMNQTCRASPPIPTA